MIVELTQKLDTITDKYKDLISQEVANQKRALAISSAKELQKAIDEIKTEGKTLQIGIVGRVKAGKSSLLNALVFDGKSILPKAATPMTAALTILKYSDELSAEVEFFTKEDIENIKKEAKEYQQKLEELKAKEFEDLKERALRKLKKPKKLLQIGNKPKELTAKDLSELEEKAKKKAIRALQEDKISSSFDQYQRMQKANIDIDELEEFSTIYAKDSKSLSNKMLEYVGADGKFMPFTKSVTIKLPNEKLKDLEIIDTPGVNDPVVSREERTRELLKYCDVIFIVSPSGQFLSNEDMDLMDRITTKEGIRELFIIASQIDNQLFGSEKDKANGVLPDVLKSITSNLGNHMSNTLSQLKETNPEVGKVFDKLIIDGKDKVLHSSGISYSIKQLFNQRDAWDDGMEHVYNSLVEEYPSYFGKDEETSKQNLDLLANIQNIDNVIDEVRIKKDNILKERENNFIEAKQKSLIQYKNNLIQYITTQYDKIKNSDINELRAKQQNIKLAQQEASSSIENIYNELLDTLSDDLDQEMNMQLKSYFRRMKSDISNAEDIQTDTWEEDYEVEKEVSASKWWNPFSWGDKKKVTEVHTRTVSETFTTVRAGAVRDSLENMTQDIEDEIEAKAKNVISRWKKDVYAKLISTLRETIGDKNLDVDTIKRTLRNIVNSIEEPEVYYTDNFPYSLRQSGTLKGADAEYFIDEAQEYVRDLQSRVKKDIKKYRKSLISTLREQNIADNIFSSYEKDMQKLEQEINQRETILEQYNNLLNELQGI